ncbi:cupin domain-containing protein [Robiginitalea aurantiaca]|uniref:Cupin domain-containing protein n=1 Tax=Robiginitalea aurantiaca TaxID=3056915 RepID=A0ABT7WBS2_9FLAO|nr:cupin domain-containing protein [Robiginitalea aurantiaca]MDM9630364.1 cupin domain-containing protein [Robiginitalea aurantiaca]
MEIEKVNINEKLGLFSAYWSPKIIGELNGQFVKIAKFKGEFMMHKHPGEDELFYVIEGELFIELISETLHLKKGEFVIIPKGTDHKPYAPEEACVLLFEPASTSNTGDSKNHLTIKDLDRI